MILNLISQKNFITFNKVIAKAIGLEEALVLGQVCSLSNIFKDKEFYFTYAEIQEETCLSEYAVKKAVQNLIKLNILTVERKGCPCKNWYTINEDVISEILDSRNRISSPPENEGTRPLENEGTRPPENKGTVIKDINKDIKTKDISISDKPKKEKSDVTIILDIYKQNYENLYNQGKVENKDPVIFYSVVGKMIKNLLRNLTKEQIIKCIDRAILDEWIVNQGYSLNVILSAGQINKLLNAKMKEPQEIRQQLTDAEYKADCDDLDNMPY